MGGASQPRLLSSYQYQLSPTGRRTAVTETRLESNDTYSSTGITYTYDALNRLTQEASGSDIPEANFNTIYTYDLVGNRLSKSSNVGASSSSRFEFFSYTYNQNDQLQTENQNVGGDVSSAIYDYDTNGSLVSKILTPDPSALSLQPSAYSYAYTYNLENRLSSATITRTEKNNNTVDISTNYIYNQSGIRVKADSSATNSATAELLFDNKKTFLIDPNSHTGYGQVLEEFDDVSSTPTVSYTIGDDVISQTTSAGTSHLMYDGHGSTRMLTNSSGNVTDRYSYDAFGIMLGGNPSSTNPTTTSLLYSGETFDVDLQQQYLRARWYDQNNGRFNRLDPFSGNSQDPQSLHKYAYTHGDPVNGIDPSGEAQQSTQLTGLHAEFARLSADVYNDTGAPDGWERLSGGKLPIGLDQKEFVDGNSGFFASLYKRNNTNLYVLAFRGTEPSGLATDWRADFVQALGRLEPQYESAINLARVVRDSINIIGGQLRMTGHSLGGGLASAAAIVSKTNGVTFNPAGVHKRTVGRYGTSLDEADNLLVRYVVKGEILDAIQSGSFFPSPLISGPVRIATSALAPNSIGRRINLIPKRPALTLLQSGAYHSMSTVLGF